MKPEDYFKPGSVPFVQAQEAINVINAAKAAGLPEAEQYEKSFMSSMDLVKNNKDWSGFDANRKAISGLAPQINAVSQDRQKKEEKNKTESSKLIAKYQSYIELGGEVDPNLQDSVTNALGIDPSNGSQLRPPNLQAIDELIERFSILNKIKIERNIPMPPEEQAKLDVAKQKEVGKTMSDIDTSEEFINVLDKLEKHEGFDNLFGTNIGIPTWISGSAGADAKSVLDQVNARAFMESIQSLKGMGALSNAEGITATNAFLSLKPSMSEDAARQTISETKRIIRSGIRKAKEMMQGDVPQTQTQTTNQNAPIIKNRPLLKGLDGKREEAAPNNIMKEETTPTNSIEAANIFFNKNRSPK